MKPTRLYHQSFEKPLNERKTTKASSKIPHMAWCTILGLAFVFFCLAMEIVHAGRRGLKGVCDQPCGAASVQNGSLHRSFVLFWNSGVDRDGSRSQKNSHVVGALGHER